MGASRLLINVVYRARCSGCFSSSTRAAAATVVGAGFSTISSSLYLKLSPQNNPLNTSRGLFCSFSMQRESAPASPSPVEELSAADFHKICDRTFEQLGDALSVLEVANNDVEVEYSQGIMNVDLGDGKGTWVINKQTPNRQIWWSSPISGPRRYEWASSSTASSLDFINADFPSMWKYTRDGSPLGEKLGEEILTKTGVDIFKDNSQ